MSYIMKRLVYIDYLGFYCFWTFALYSYVVKVKKNRNENRNYFESLLNELPIAVTVKSIDNSFRYTFWNKKATEVLQYDSSEVRGQNYNFYKDRVMAHDLQFWIRKLLVREKLLNR